jgi:DNA-binding PadR family transcriptional regulator
MASPSTNRFEKLSDPKSVAIGAVYATLDRLEDKGLVSSWLSDPTPQRGGRSKRHYRLEENGKRALRESIIAAQRIHDAVAEVWSAALLPGKWKSARQK